MFKKLSWWQKGSVTAPNKYFDDITSVGLRGEAILAEEKGFSEFSSLADVHIDIADETSDEGTRHSEKDGYASEPIEYEYGNEPDFYSTVETGTSETTWSESKVCSENEWTSPDKENFSQTVFNTFSSKQLPDNSVINEKHSTILPSMSSPAESKTSAESDAEPEDEIELLFSKLRHNRIAYVKEALREGFDIQSTDCRGNTMLHICAQNDNKKIASTLLKLGCNVNKENKKGLTALDFAHMYRFQTLAELLSDFGADFGSRNHR